MTAVIILIAAAVMASNRRQPPAAAQPSDATVTGMVPATERITAATKSRAFLGGSPVLGPVLGGRVVQLNSATEVEPTRELDLPPALRESMKKSLGSAGPKLRLRG